MVIFVEPPTYRQSYVEKDRLVRNSLDVEVPGVDLMQGFELPKEEFEKVFLQAHDSFDAHTNSSISTPKRRKRRRPWRRARPPTPTKPKLNCRLDEETATLYADNCRREGANLQREQQLDKAGMYYERACVIRAYNGLFCTHENAVAHVEYAQNLARRGGLIGKAEYHLRTALDIYRLLDMRYERVYADTLLYTAVLVDQQVRCYEAESFYRAALTVYKKNGVCDGNVSVAIDSLIHNLRRQGRVQEADDMMTNNTLLLREDDESKVKIELPSFHGHQPNL